METMKVMENNKKSVMADAKSEEVFNYVYRKYAKLVLNVAYRYLKDGQLAEEVLQEVMFRYYLYMDDERLTRVRPWLVRITRNLSINILKKRRMEISSCEIELISDYRETDLTSGLDPAVRYMEAERQKEISELCEEIFRELKETNEKEYRAIRALYQNEKNEKEIAKDMDMTEGAFYTMLCRAKAKVRKKYGSQYDGIKEL